MLVTWVQNYPEGSLSYGFGVGKIPSELFLEPILISASNIGYAEQLKAFINGPCRFILTFLRLNIELLCLDWLIVAKVKML